MAIFSLILLPVSFYSVFSDMEKYFPFPEMVPIIKIGIVMFLFDFFYIYMVFGRGNKTKKDNTDSSEKSSERTLDESKED